MHSSWQNDDNGKKFPTVKIELNSGGLKNTNVVIEMQKQLLDVLNINVEFEIVSLQQKINDAKHAQAEIFRSCWIADYPSPENFLWLFYGANVPETLDQPSYPNTTRYKNTEYDQLFKLAKNAKTLAESYSYFNQAEQIMIKEAPIMVLWYDENYRLVRSHVKNLLSNPIRFRDYSQVYLQNTDRKKILVTR